MDDVMDAVFDPGSREVARRLEAFGDVRLTPSAAATTRMRAVVMVAAHRRAALIATDSTTAVAAAVDASPRLPALLDRGGHWRRPVAALLTGTLTLGILAGTALAVRPGGPLYGARMWTEMATLPSTGLPRAAAEVVRLEARLDEVLAAVAAGDGAAAEAALEAYIAILAEAAAGSVDDAQATDAIEVTVQRHVLVLTALLDKVPASAVDAIQHALASSTKFLDDADGSGGAGSGGGGGTNSGGTNNGGTNNGGTNSGGTNNGGTNNGGTNSGGTNNGGGTDSGGTDSGGTNSGGTNSGGTVTPPPPAVTPTARPPRPSPPGHVRSPRPDPPADHGSPNDEDE